MARKSIKEIGHLWRYIATRDYIEIDVTDNRWEPSLKTIKTVFCRVQRYKDGTPYVRHNRESWVIDVDEPTT